MIVLPSSRTNDGRTNDGRTNDGRTNDGRTNDGRTNDRLYLASSTASLYLSWDRSSLCSRS